MNEHSDEGIGLVFCLELPERGKLGEVGLTLHLPTIRDAWPGLTWESLADA